MSASHAHGHAPAPASAPAHESAPASNRHYFYGALATLAGILFFGSLLIWWMGPARHCLQCGIKPAPAKVVVLPPPPPEPQPPTHEGQTVIQLPPPPPLPPAPAPEALLPVSPEPAVQVPACSGGRMSKILISTSVPIREVIMPFASPDSNDQVTQLTPHYEGAEIDFSTCGDLSQNFWIAFNKGFSVSDDDKFMVWISIGGNAYQQDADFVIKECDSPRCATLNSYPDDGRVYMAVVWQKH